VTEQRQRALRLGLALAAGLTGLAVGMDASPELPTPLPEYQVKAAFLFNFARFVEWPSDAFDDPRSPLVIGVLGTDPFGPDLDAVMRDKTVHGRSILVQRYPRATDVGPCHVLFVGRGESGRLRRGQGLLKDTGVLTVGEEAGPRAGTMIRLSLVDNRVRFEVDLAAVQDAKLKISSKLLRLGKLAPTGSASR
jgi:hypothetical protein